MTTNPTEPSWKACWGQLLKGSNPPPADLQRCAGRPPRRRSSLARRLSSSQLAAVPGGACRLCGHRSAVPPWNVPRGGLAYLVDRSSPPGNSATGRPLPGASCNQAMRKCAEFPAHQLIRSGFTTGVARPTDADSRPRTTESADQRTGLGGVERTRACRTKASGRQRP